MLCILKREYQGHLGNTSKIGSLTYYLGFESIIVNNILTLNYLGKKKKGFFFNTLRTGYNIPRLGFTLMIIQTRMQAFFKLVLCLISSLNPHCDARYVVNWALSVCLKCISGV